MELLYVNGIEMDISRRAAKYETSDNFLKTIWLFVTLTKTLSMSKNKRITKNKLIFNIFISVPFV